MKTKKKKPHAKTYKKNHLLHLFLSVPRIVIVIIIIIIIIKEEVASAIVDMGVQCPSVVLIPRPLLVVVNA
jgi:hypothetical protein